MSTHAAGDAAEMARSVVTVQEAAQKLGISERGVTKRIERGRVMTAVKMAGRWFIARCEVEAMAEGGR